MDGNQQGHPDFSWSKALDQATASIGTFGLCQKYNLVLEVDRLIDKIVRETGNLTLDELTQLKKDFLDVEESG